MLSPVFWLSLVAVFWGVKWAADGLMSLARVEVRHIPATAPEAGLMIDAEPQTWRENAPAPLEKAA